MIAFDVGGLGGVGLKIRVWILTIFAIAFESRGRAVRFGFPFSVGNGCEVDNFPFAREIGIEGRVKGGL